MANRMKVKGDTWERDVRYIARTSGFPGAERTKAGYARDSGDIHLDPTLGIGPACIVACKDVKTPNWTEWLQQLADQKEESRAEQAFIALKRSRPGKKPLKLAIMPLEDMLILLRKAGYGTELDTE